MPTIKRVAAGRIIGWGMACKSLIAAAALLSAAPALAMADTARFNIPAQPMPAALKSFAAQAHMQLLYQYDAVAELRGNPVVGDEEKRDALQRLIRNTGLEAVFSGESAATIRPVKANAETHSLPDAPPNASGSSDAPKEGKRSEWFRVAQVDQRPSSNTVAVEGRNPPPQEASARGATLDEIVVTASKRPETLRELANSVTAFTDKELEDLGAQGFQDYLGRAPGVIFQGSTPGIANVTIRGIGTATVYPDQGQATTGIYLNDIPLTDPGFAVSVPDLDVFDVQRVEVLRGPQGTLFGSASLGGAVNYILNPVSLTNYEAAAQISGSRAASSSDTGYAIKGAANLPLVTDVFGIRLTGIQRADAGYLDNIGTGRKDTNTHDVTAARVNALWQIAPAVKLSFFTFYDRAKNGDGFYAFPSLGDLVRTTIVPEQVTFTTRINNLKLDADLGFATLSASAADSHKSQDFVADLSPYYGSPTTTAAVATTHSQIGEVRLTSPGKQTFDWLVGAYFGWFDEYYPSPTFQANTDVFDFNVGYRSNETAVFGEAAYHFNDHWRVTVGGRSYNIRVRTNIVQGDPSAPPEQSDTGWEKANGFSPKASLTFEPNSMLMSYALVSKGFRMGGVNLVAPLSGFATPATYGPDHLINYELGLRLSSADHTLSFDTAAFFIDWTNIQLRLNRPDGFSYVANAGAARSKGLENSLNWKPIQGLSLQASVTYLDAALAEPLALGNGTTLPDGAQLPGASKWSTSETVEYRFPGPLSPHVLVSHRFLSGAYSDFSTALPIGNYHTVDLRGGIEVGHVGITAFVANLANRRGVTAAAFFGTPVTEYYVPPRTIGLQFDWHL